jgi:uncharacterized protein
MGKSFFLFFAFLLLTLNFGCGNKLGIKNTQNNKVTRQEVNKKEDSNRPVFDRGTVLIEKENGKNIELDVEIADNSEKQAYGLMQKDYLGENQGMWFIFDNMEYRTFWMKNTLIPLDMIFIDNENKVVDIIENAVPCEDDRCDFYGNLIKNKFVLEVNSGFTKSKDIQIGDKIYFENDN